MFVCFKYLADLFRDLPPYFSFSLFLHSFLLFSFFLILVRRKFFDVRKLFSAPLQPFVRFYLLSYSCTYAGEGEEEENSFPPSQLPFLSLLTLSHTSLCLFPSRIHHISCSLLCACVPLFPSCLLLPPSRLSLSSLHSALIIFVFFLLSLSHRNFHATSLPSFSILLSLFPSDSCSLMLERTEERESLFSPSRAFFFLVSLVLEKRPCLLSCACPLHFLPFCLKREARRKMREEERERGERREKVMFFCFK